MSKYNLQSSFEIFNLSYGIKEIPSNAGVFIRKASKAVIRKGNKILLILTNKGDLKFPGGGHKDNESVEECLKRELLEETGFKLKYLHNLLGRVVENNLDKYEADKYFSMQSEYYSVEIDTTIQEKLNLDAYEKEQCFKPIFIDINEALKQNEKIINNEREHNPWVQRETDVLKKLIQMENRIVVL